MSGRVVAVVPAYNEELAIGSVVLEARKHVEEVIVVDDGSTDRTAEIAGLAGAVVLRLDQNYGKAQALMRGFDFGEAERIHCRGDVGRRRTAQPK